MIHRTVREKYSQKVFRFYFSLPSLSPVCKMSGFQDLSVFPVEVLQLSVLEEEVSPEQQKSSSLNQVISEPLQIKDEPEELWSSQEGEQIHEPVGEDIKFTFVPVPVKREDDKEKHHSSQFHQRHTKQMETGADGVDCGGAEAARYFVPERDLKPETESQTDESSDPESDDSTDWRETTQHQSGFMSVEKSMRTGAKTEEKLHDCSLCVRRFKTKQGLHTHMVVHTKEKPFSCSVCDKRFSQKGSVTRHMSIHIGEKPFVCSLCGKMLRSKFGLNIHMAAHTKEKPFICSECGQRFTQKGNVLSHMKIHTGDNFFFCPQCGKRLSHKNALTRHMIVHTKEKPFSCSVCGQKFPRKDALTVHMRIHTGEKPFGCSVCGQRFTQKASVTSHMRIHKRVKPFRCSVK
ncbi:zinc finger protein OZF-like [Cheilinus undulatus]|uniref:zinc finger protein OZF-like n=1 Tax=Cheilinus undulatus TaxID=241271 RepID=UPI001BD3C94B|nr:zinc finger protein OZF-like [Cheilinus undulatus]